MKNAEQLFHLSPQELADLGVNIHSVTEDVITLFPSEKALAHRELLEFASGRKIIFSDATTTKVYEDDDAARFIAEDVAASAYRKHASDIHIEPYAGGARLRFRIEGRLVHHTDLSREQYESLSNFLKITAHLDVGLSRLPQDGRLSLPIEGGQLDLRISTAPTIEGEKIVLRLLRRENILRGVSELGWTSEQTQFMKRLLEQRSGLILLTGPTNSGKTTSIYALLQELNSSQKNIMTIEDPVEYRLEGVNQIQVHEKIGLDFYQGLRTVLRQDPDVLVVGEIRNEQTARIALRAAMTGTLVLATIHSQDSISCILRLQDMGMEKHLIAESLLAIISQRLVNLLCPHCRRESLENDSYFFPSPTTVYEEVGCSHCHDGVHGRMAVAEILPFDGQIRRCVYEGAPLEKYANLMEVKQLPRLRHRLASLVKEGGISLTEARRAINTL